MNFSDAIRSGFRRYVDFRGRSARAEFWYWMLFVFVVQLCLSVLDAAIFDFRDASPLSSVFVLATLLPGFAVMARRLHDIDRTGWWILIWLIPVLGWIVLIVWACRKGDGGPNRFGAAPMTDAGPHAPTPA